MFPLAFIAGWLQGHWWGFISRNYVVWPTFLLMNVFIALKGSHFWFLSEMCFSVLFLVELIRTVYCFLLQIYCNHPLWTNWCQGSIPLFWRTRPESQIPVNDGSRQNSHITIQHAACKDRKFRQRHKSCRRRVSRVGENEHISRSFCCMRLFQLEEYNKKRNQGMDDLWNKF